jgi:formylglycine-generating enzyme
MRQENQTLIGVSNIADVERGFVLRPMIWTVALCTLLTGWSVARADIIMETVPVGNAGNPADPATGFGAVCYSYNIGKYEVTAGQYTAFLNAVAATDPYSLYNPSMADTSGGSGITQHGISGSFTYTVDSAFVNRPVICVSFWDACRFANWLNNGQQGAGTTEYGAYTLTSGGTVTRNAGSQWAVASDDEWYKAAYYNPAANNYYIFPTRSNTWPGNDLADPLGNNANYYTGSGTYPIDSGIYTTIVGQFQNSASPYGTFDQAGNVWEWNETVWYTSQRGMRGGSFRYGDNNLWNGQPNHNTPDFETWALGFRVVQVPEPASLAVFGFGAVVLLMRRQAAGRQAIGRRKVRPKD